MPGFTGDLDVDLERGLAGMCVQDDHGADSSETAVRKWVEQAERDAGNSDDGGLTSDERRELAELCRENRKLKEDVEIFKRTTAFFAKETRWGCTPFIEEAEKARQGNVKRACELLRASC